MLIYCGPRNRLITWEELDVKNPDKELSNTVREFPA